MNGRLFLNAFALVSLLMVSARAMAAEPVRFFVSPDGDDSAAGTFVAPFATFEAARDAVRELREAAPHAGPATIECRGGLYFRTATFELSEQDSGTPDAPVIWQNYKNETVRLVGGIVLKPDWFRPVHNAARLARLHAPVRNKVRQCNLRQHGIENFGELGALGGGLGLFCGGERRPLGRWPNDGWSEARSAKTLELDHAAAAALAREGRFGPMLAFRYTGSSPRKWATLDGVWIRGIWQQEYWLDGWHPKDFDPEKRRLTMDFNAYPHLSDWRRFYVANVFEELDRPGEWYLDRKKGVLYLYPPERFGVEPLLASMLEPAMVRLSATAHVIIRGWTLEAMRGTAAVISGGTGNALEACTIRNARYAAMVSGGENNGLSGCGIYGLEGMGIHLNGGERKTLAAANLYVDNCHIHHYGQRLMNWQPGVKVQGVGNRVTHCAIHHAPQYAISYEGNDHRFEFNDLHHLCLEMSDVGVIGCGTDWTYRGNVIRCNYIHHIPERPYPGVCCVYFDNCASSALVHGNVFYKVPKAVMIGGGRDHAITNNLFIQCDVPVYMDNRGLRWDHFREGGPMYELLDKVNHDEPPWSTRYPKLARILDERPQAPLGNVLRRNVSVRSNWRNPEEVCRAMFQNNIEEQYMDVGENLVTDKDPGFADMSAQDFRLRKDSAVFKAIPGFEAIAFEKIGPHGKDG